MLNIWQLNWQFGNVLKNQSIGKTSNSMITQLIEMRLNDERARNWFIPLWQSKWVIDLVGVKWFWINFILNGLRSVPITNQPFAEQN